MKKPSLRQKPKFDHIRDYPEGTYYEAGHLVETNDSWRTFRPVLDDEACRHCLICYMVCPDGTIEKGENVVAFDYEFCKGCGICEYECPFDAIEMEVEE